MAAQNGNTTPIRSHETFLELTYQAQVTPWVQAQPDLQYVLSPGGGIADPNNRGRRLGDEVILGARTGVTF